MVAVVETSFFCPKNVRFFNPLLGRAPDANRRINWLRPIAKNQEFEMITSCHFKNLISSKPTWNSQWSLISSRNLKWEYHFAAHTSPIFSVFLKKNRFLRKSSKPGHGNLVLIIYFNWSSSTFKVEIQLWWYENLFSLGFKGLPTNNFCRT